MQAATSPARQERAYHRHHLHTLTYVTLDEANGGIVRNLSGEGIAVQAVAALRPMQIVRVRFELRYPRLRIDTQGEVVWSNPSGQCGIRFLDVPHATTQQIRGWIFGNLLEFAPRIPWAGEYDDPRSRADRTAGDEAGKPQVDDGLILSPSATRVIQLDRPTAHLSSADGHSSRELSLAKRSSGVSEAKDSLFRDFQSNDFRSDELQADELRSDELRIGDRHSDDLHSGDLGSGDLPSFEVAPRADWLSQPLAGRSLALTIDSLMVFAGLLVFSLVFLVITQQLPRWPLTVGGGAVVFVAVFYWAFFQLVAGASLGSHLAHLAESGSCDDPDENLESSRFR